MPMGPRDEIRPADVAGAAVPLARIWVGDFDETLRRPSSRVRSGADGAKACVESATADQRTEIARTAAGVRWE